MVSLLLSLNKYISHPAIGSPLHLILPLIYTYMYIYIYMVFNTEGFFEVAIESWPELDLDLNPRPLNSFQTL